MGRPGGRQGGGVMARIRSIHPGLFTDEAFVDLSDAAQIFLVGLWTEADDQGVFEWKPTTLRMRLRPAKDGSTDALLSELVDANCIRPYEIDGRKLGAIRNFRKYQRPKFPKSIHTITDDIRKYTGSSPPATEIEGDDDGSIPRNEELKADSGGSFPRNEEIASQMERRGERKKDAAPNGARPPDEETELFRRGKQVLGNNAGGLIAKLLKAKSGNVALARAAVEQASQRQDAREYIGGIVRGQDPPGQVYGVDRW